MKIFYVTNRHPCSYNGTSKAKLKFKTDVQTEFRVKYAHLYQNLPEDNKTLKAHIVFLHQFKNIEDTPDADNLSKPLVDAFCGIIYKDDRQVISRKAEILKLQDFDFMTVDATDMPLEIYNDFQKYYLHKSKHIIFYEITEFLPSQIKIGEL